MAIAYSIASKASLLWPIMYNVVAHKDHSSKLIDPSVSNLGLIVERASLDLFLVSISLAFTMISSSVCTGLDSRIISSSSATSRLSINGASSNCCNSSSTTLLSSNG